MSAVGGADQSPPQKHFMRDACKVRQPSIWVLGYQRFQRLSTGLAVRVERNSLVSSTPMYLKQHVSFLTIEGTVSPTNTVIKISAKSSTSSALPYLRNFSNA